MLLSFLAFYPLPNRRVVIKMQKKVNKIFLPAILALSILVIGILATNVSAQDISNYPPIVQKIADRFNLNVSEVQQVFDEDRDAHRADMYAHFAERLNDMVSDGKLTETQKEAILDKHEEMQDKMEEFKNLSVDERHEKMQALREEFKTWAESQGIDLSVIGPFGHGFGHGFKASHMMITNQ